MMAFDSDLERLFVSRLFQAAIDGSLPAEFSEELVVEFMRDTIGPATTVALLRQMLELNLIRQTRADPVEYEVTIVLLRMGEELGANIEPLFEIAGSSDTVTDDDGIPLVTVPASDRIVPLDHNSSEYTEATRTLDKVIEEFRKDHRLDNELGPEKPALLKTLEAGRRLLDDTKIKADIAITLLVEPLKLVAKRYESELVGALAAGAVTIILALLGFI